MAATEGLAFFKLPDSNEKAKPRRELWIAKMS
jgi:hypothetical protein